MKKKICQNETETLMNIITFISPRRRPSAQTLLIVLIYCVEAIIICGTETIT